MEEPVHFQPTYEHKHWHLLLWLGLCAFAVLAGGFVYWAYLQNPSEQDAQVFVDTTIPQTSDIVDTIGTQTSEATTTIVDNIGRATGYFKDSSSVYFKMGPNYNETVKGADPRTFSVISYQNSSLKPLYAKDNVNVYFGFSKLEGADPSTFTSYAFETEGGNDEYGKDKNHVWLFEFLIPETDPPTFTVLNSLQSCGIGCVYEAQDKDHKYLQDRIVK